MKPFIRKITLSAIVAMGANGLLVAPPVTTWSEHRSIKQSSASPEAVVDGAVAAQANDQQMALKKCMEATERVRMQVSQMQAMGRPWSRGRFGYSRNDLVALSDYLEELVQALINLGVVHQEFRQGLSPVQEQRLELPLSKLDHLQADLNHKISEIDHDLKKAEPGPDSTGIAWDVNTLKRAADKWRSEHVKIAKQMNVAMSETATTRSAFQ
jgi:hypothetical protein